ncbi:chitobiase/beta-hexosaminidase C-terminal domain-containing protein [Flavihumibacter profundi]|jgi:uncharacterized membrane protein|uniref:chitobiase/beta-hexosaminidase C-terminal domain-containing protein n=1 Tax=Flavihumibacter profundi TaxID=2716883 RepID=UPI001CC6EF95|nr:chitobiase/beta-hexosaminidase C-terminal domain-containing protein [Flavihumibacter profundi]MBZ5856689.1 chitobiase/beta-hexosaminidase C-terminal domain-containing protein [Flavihumibacter profundi]
MRSWKTFFINGIFAGNCLLVFLLVAEEFVVIPHWLQVAGRMHPLILHFPLVLIILSVLWEGFFMRQLQQPSGEKIGDALMISTAGFTMITAVMGMILSREPGYEQDSISWHKWGGIILSIGCMAWYSFRGAIRANNGFLVSSGIVTLLTLVITGHEGASITHGDNFLLAPVTKDKVKLKVNIEEAKVYADIIHPILESKCLGCHNSKKAKGELVMETAAGLYKGGKNGILWDSAANEFGLLLQRLHLPLDDKKHMPPKGKMQLTPEEATLLALWIKKGADTANRYLALDPSDSIRILAAQYFTTGTEEEYTFPAAPEKTIQSLNNHYRLVAQIAAESPALQVSFFGASQYKSSDLNELLAVKQQVVSMHLNKIPVTDKDLEIIGQFPELRELNLSFTDITDTGLNSLLTLKSLNHLSLSGTHITAAGLKKLQALKKLKKLYCWSTTVPETEIAGLRKIMPETDIEYGYSGDTVRIRLNPPIIENEEMILTGATALRLKHFVNGVDIRYTLDGQEPDSINSPKYDGKTEINSAVTLRTKAFKNGWLSSETISRSFFKVGLAPDSVYLKYDPDPAYKGKGARTLFDAIKGDNNFRNGLWLGFKDKPMDLVIQFNEPKQVSSVNISGLVDIGSYLMPPAEIQVWGGVQGSPLRLLSTIKPKQPVKDTAGYQISYPSVFKPATVTQMRLVVRSVNPLPKWHNGKGEKGWFFADEVFIQ